LTSLFPSNDPTLGYLAFQISSNLLFFVGFILLIRLLEYPVWSIPVLLLLVIYLFLPFGSDFDNANLNRVLFGLVAAAIAGTSRPGTGGPVAGAAILGFAVMLKPTVALAPLLLAAFRIRQGQWRKLALEGAGCVSAMVIAYAMSSLHFRNAAIWGEWLGQTSSLVPAGYPVTLGNFSISAILMSMTGTDLARPIIWIGGSLLIAISALSFIPVPGDPTTGKKSDWISGQFPVYLGCLSFLLFSPMVWFHYSLLALPAFILLWKRAPGSGMVSIAFRALVLLSVSMTSLWPIRFIQWRHDQYTVALLGLISWGGTLIAWTLLIIALRSRDRLSVA
jgi:hypothetical protein